MKEIFKKQDNGITLIALVVTVVVLLILAGISIKVLTGENGIITQARQAKEESIIADEKESIGVAYVRCEEANKTGTNVTDSQMEQALIQDGKDVKVITEEGDLEVAFNDTKHKYIIDEEGNIEKVKDLTSEEANKIVDVVYYCKDEIYVLTAGGEVRQAYSVSGEIFAQLEVVEEGNVITKKGVNKKGDDWFIDNKGKVHIWEYYGGSSVPICISEIEGNALKGKRIVEISEGVHHTVAVDSEGKVYTWGYNGDGQLGNGITEDSNIPICISNIQGNALKGKRIVEISAGDYHTVAIDSEGEVYTWGYNRNGQLGNGTTTNSTVPICISNIQGNALKGKRIVEISTGMAHTVAIDSEGKVYTWGYNEQGQLGNGTWDDSNIPICISEIEGNALNGKTITDIYSHYTVIAKDTEGKIYTWGYNRYGQLGDGERYNNRYEPICISDIPYSDIYNLPIKKMGAGETYASGADYNYIYYIAENNQVYVYLWIERPE